MHRLYGAILGLGLAAGLSTAAQAAAVGCTIDNSQDGSSTITGTYVGQIGFVAPYVCQIGQEVISPTMSNPASAAEVNAIPPAPSYYEFYWGGGDLSIKAEIGLDGAGGLGYPDVNLELLSNNGTNSSNATVATLVAGESISIAGSTTVPEYGEFNDVDLAAGYYDINAELASSSAGDPQLQINFAVPEPITLSLFGAGLVGAGALRRRRRNAKIKQR